MTFPVRALGDPALQKFDFLDRERLARIWRRHAEIVIRAVYALHQETLFRVSRNNRWATISLCESGGLLVEPEFGLPVIGVRAVTPEALVGQNRLDLPRETHVRHVGSHNHTDHRG